MAVTNYELYALSQELHDALDRLQKKFGISYDDADSLTAHGVDAELATPWLVEQLERGEL